MTCAPEENAIAGGFAGSGMGSGIVGAEVGFNFHDAPGPLSLSIAAQQYFAQQLTRNLARIALEK
jgi:hypothetical protein